MRDILQYVMRCAIWYRLCNLKNVKNPYWGVLLLVKLHAKSAQRVTYDIVLVIFIDRSNLIYSFILSDIRNWMVDVDTDKLLCTASINILLGLAAGFSSKKH